MSKRIGLIATLLMTLLVAGRPAPAHAEGWIGGGIHYLRNLGDITADGAVDLEQNSFSIIASGKNDFGPLKLDGQLEYVFDFVGTGEAMWQPSLWLLAGGMIYGGGGIGIGYTDGDWQKNPFYALRAGAAIPLDKIELDVYGTYRFQNEAELKSLTGEDLDSVTFAALVRFGLF